jgi:hypothetical protein
VLIVASNSVPKLLEPETILNTVPALPALSENFLPLSSINVNVVPLEPLSRERASSHKLSRCLGVLSDVTPELVL